MKVAVAISGGVDSAVAALLLKERGHDLAGVTMALGRPDEERSVAEARAVADRLGIPLHVLDLGAAWRTEVCAYVRDTYLTGRTPNPCVRCNEMVKFGLLPHYAFGTLGCASFATGHYARIVDGRLFRGVDHAKDQSYFLYRVRPDIRARTLLPLGDLTKSEVRDRARAFGFAAAERADSQDFCGGDPQTLVDAADRPGDIVTLEGRVLGRHRGFWHYTVGMRKGLGIGGGTPFYVVRLEPDANRVVVGTREQAVRRELTLVDTVGVTDRTLPVKVRSAGEPRLLAEGVAGIAPGQSAVFYRGEEVVGGGIIACDADAG